MKEQKRAKQTEEVFARQQKEWDTKDKTNEGLKAALSMMDPVARKQALMAVGAEGFGLAQQQEAAERAAEALDAQKTHIANAAEHNKALIESHDLDRQSRERIEGLKLTRERAQTNATRAAAGIVDLTPEQKQLARNFAATIGDPKSTPQQIAAAENGLRALQVEVGLGVGKLPTLGRSGDKPTALPGDVVKALLAHNDAAVQTGESLGDFIGWGGDKAELMKRARGLAATIQATTGRRPVINENGTINYDDGGGRLSDEAYGKLPKPDGGAKPGSGLRAAAVHSKAGAQPTEQPTELASYARGLGYNVAPTVDANGQAWLPKAEFMAIYNHEPKNASEALSKKLLLNAVAPLNT